MSVGSKNHCIQRVITRERTRTDATRASRERERERERERDNANLFDHHQSHIINLLQPDPFLYRARGGLAGGGEGVGSEIDKRRRRHLDR